MVTLIILIFVPGDLTAELAHVSSHCVTGITLPPVDATLFFIGIPALCWDLKKKSAVNMHGESVLRLIILPQHQHTRTLGK